MSEDPIGGPLVLRHASKRSSGTWGPDDYDVISNGWASGASRTRWPASRRLSLDVAITAAVVMPALPSHGFCASLDEAKAKSDTPVGRDLDS